MEIQKRLRDYLDGVNIFDYLTFPITANKDILNIAFLGMFGNKIISPLAESTTPENVIKIAELMNSANWERINNISDVNLTSGIKRVRTTAEKANSSGNTTDKQINSKKAFNSVETNETDSTDSSGTNTISSGRDVIETELETNNNIYDVISNMKLFPDSIEFAIIKDVGELLTCSVYCQ